MELCITHGSIFFFVFDRSHRDWAPRQYMLIWAVSNGAWKEVSPL